MSHNLWKHIIFLALSTCLAIVFLVTHTVFLQTPSRLAISAMLEPFSNMDIIFN